MTSHRTTDYRIIARAVELLRAGILASDLSDRLPNLASDPPDASRWAWRCCAGVVASRVNLGDKLRFDLVGVYGPGSFSS